MSYLQKHKKKSFPYKTIILVIVVAGLLVWNPGIPEPVRKTVYDVGEPLWGVGTWFENQMAFLGATLKTKKELRKERDDLKKELNRIRHLSLTTEVLRAENASLRELLGRSATTTSMVAAVLSRPNKTPYDTFIIDVGKSDNIARGNIVTVDGAAIGVVSDVYAKTALVTLLSAPGIETDVLVGPKEVGAIAIGRGNNNFHIELPRGVEVKEGDVIVTPNLTPQLIATVEHIESDPADPFKTVFFKAPITLSEVRFVLVYYGD